MTSSQRAGGTAEIYVVEATVFALIPEFELVMLRTADDFQLALTLETAGIDLSKLRKGQRVRCTVTQRLHRVLSAVILS